MTPMTWYGDNLGILQSTGLLDSTLKKETCEYIIPHVQNLVNRLDIIFKHITITFTIFHLFQGMSKYNMNLWCAAEISYFPDAV